MIKVWGNVLEKLPVVLIMTHGWFALIFPHPEQANWVLSKFWHIEMTSVLLKDWTSLFDLDKEKFGACPISVRLLGLPLQFW